MSAQHQVITREQAKSLGLKRFFTSQACPKGHIEERYTCDGQCVMCCRIKLKEKYDKNPARENERRQKYYHANIDKVREMNAARVREARKNKPEIFTEQERRRREKIKNDPIRLEKERERQRVKQAKAYAKNPEKYINIAKEYRALPHKKVMMNEKCKEYKRKNPDVIRALNQKHNPIDRAARMKRVPIWLTEDDLKKIRAIYDEARSRGMHVDHIIPLQGKIVSGLHVPNNLQLLTPSENSSKRNAYEVN